MNFILFFMYSNGKQFYIKVTYTNNSQNDWHLSKCKRVLQSVYRTPINQFLRFVQLPTCFFKFLLRIIQYDDISYQENSGSITRSLVANARNTAAVKKTGSIIL